MTLKHRDKVCIRANEEFEIDLKRLRFRFKLDSDQKTIKSAVHMLATMNIADFLQFVKAYSDRVVYDNQPTLQRTGRDSKIQRAGGVDILVMYKTLGYTREETAAELDCTGDDIYKWLKRRGLSWKNLK